MTIEPHHRIALAALTPRYRPEQHKHYVDALLQAFTEDCDGKIHLIALTGQFGTGKSSVVEGLLAETGVQKLKPTKVSLGTIDADAVAARTGPAGEQSSSALSNVIQKEIVKQLLYSRAPRDMPLSRYRRLTSPSKGRLVGESLAMAFVTSAVTLAIIHRGAISAPMCAVAVGAVCGAAWWTFRARWSSRLSWSELKAGNGPGSLTVKNDTTWFDEYIDELVYFFDSSKCRLVVFEDLDRFQDPHIFEMLRELNTLLNNAGQLRRPGQPPIRFLCAIRDSVFDTQRADAGRLGDADSQAARRIKLFDLIVPMVPFVSPRTARENLRQALGADAADVSDDVLRITSDHVTDYRLMTTIANEYRMLHDVVRHQTELLSLDASRVFAMAVYKVLYPGDYDGILAGTSTLNQLQHHVDTRKIDLIQQLTSAEVEVQRVVGPQVGSTDRRRLGRMLASFMNRFTTATAIEMDKQTTFDSKASDDPAFWRGAVATGVQISAPYISFTLQPDDLAHMLELDSADIWDAGNATAVTDDLNKLHAAKQDLTQARWQDVIKPQPPVLLQSTGQSIERPALVGADIGPSLDPLQMAFIREGYLDNLFPVYASKTDPGDLTAAAWGFVLTVIDNPKPTPSMTYKFDGTPGEIATMLKLTGEAFFRDERCLNITLFDYLLEHHSNLSADDYIRTCCAATESAQAFRRLYRREGAYPERFAELTAGYLATAFTETTGDFASGPQLAAMLGATLLGASPTVDYAMDRVNLSVIAEHRPKMDALENAGPVASESIARVLGSLNYREPDLGTVPEQPAGRLIDRHLFVVNEANLRFLTGESGDSSVALDRIPADQQDYIIDNITQYLDVLEQHPDYRSITDAQAAPPALNQVAAYAAEGLDDAQQDLLLTRANHEPAWALESLADVWWPCAVRNQLVAITWPAVTAYHDNYGDLAPWEALLNTHDPAPATEEAETTTPSPPTLTSILGMVDLPPARRQDLVLSAGASMALADVPPEADFAIPALVRGKVIADDAAAFARLAPNPKALHDLVTTSRAIKTYLPNLNLGAQEAEVVAQSGRQDLLAPLLAMADAILDMTPTTADQLLAYASQHAPDVTPDQLEALGSRASDKSLLERAIPVLAGDYALTDLQTILALLGPELAGLSQEEVRVTEEHLPLLTFLKNKGTVTMRRLPQQAVYTVKPAAP